MTIEKRNDRFSKDELRQWLNGYRDGDAEAFEKFFKATKGVLFAYLKSRLPQTDAEEAFQETYFRVHRSIRTFQVDGNALAWIFRIAENAANDLFSKRKRSRANLTDDSIVENVASEIHDPETQAQLRQLLNSMLDGLEPDDRRLLETRILGENTFSEISTKLGISEVSARQKFSRIIRKLKKISA